MRILNQDDDNKIDNVCLYLTRKEMVQMQGYIDQLLQDPDMHHAHLSSECYQKEITICTYDKKNLSSFDARSKKLILEDE